MSMPVRKISRGVVDIDTPAYRVRFYQIGDTWRCESSGKFRGSEGELIRYHAHAALDLAVQRVELAVIALGEALLTVLTSLAN